jgi:hypothetical protein
MPGIYQTCAFKALLFFPFFELLDEETDSQISNLIKFGLGTLVRYFRQGLRFGNRLHPHAYRF